MFPCVWRDGGLCLSGLMWSVAWIIDWPAQSPDLKPIKHHWDELEYRLRARPNRPSVPDLFNDLVAELKQDPSAMFQHLVESLPRRVEAVIAAKSI